MFALPRIFAVTASAEGLLALLRGSYSAAGPAWRLDDAGSFLHAECPGARLSPSVRDGSSAVEQVLEFAAIPAPPSLGSEESSRALLLLLGLDLIAQVAPGRCLRLVLQ